MTNDNLLYSLNEKPLGKSWEEHTISWWKRIYSIPNHENPINDRNGDLQDGNQPDLESKVFHLTATHDSKVVRRCKIPTGMSILFPVAANAASYAEFPNLKTESDLYSYAEEGNKVLSMKVTIDGQELKNLEEYKVKSSVFKVKLPDDGIWNWVKGGDTTVAGIGYWVFLKPLPPGNHVLEFSQTTEDHPPSGTLNCSYDVLYDLEVQ
jgi:hypothetical protein